MSQEKKKHNYEKILKQISKKVSMLNEKDIELFFRAFLTPSEIIEICDRFLIVDELIAKKSQREISKEIGVSISKITSGSRELKFGSGSQIFEKFVKL